MNSNYTGPIIQGTAVPAPGSIPSNNNNNNGNPKETYHASTAGETYYNDTGGYGASASAVPFGEQYSHQQQQQQPNQFRDVFWAIAFLIHLGVMIVLISTNLAGQNGNDNGGDDNGGGAGLDAYGGTFVFVALSVLVSMGLSTSTISLMMKFPAGMVKLGLIFSAFLSGVFALLLLSSGSGLGMILGIFFFAMTVCYVCSVWNRIPYAAGESFWFGGWICDGFDGSMNVMDWDSFQQSAPFVCIFGLFVCLFICLFVSLVCGIVPSWLLTQLRIHCAVTYFSFLVHAYIYMHIYI